MSNVLFRGIMPALATPLREDGSVHECAVAPMIQWMLGKGVDGFYVLGGTGEGGALAEGERMKMAEAAADALRGSGKKLILHVGAADTQSAIRLARHASQVGADAISSVYPNFFCSYGVQEAVDYYRALVEASGLPMLCYCSNMIREQKPLTLAEQLMKIEGVIGLKYTFPNYYVLQQIKRLNGGDINVINGPDETLLCGLCMGADGGIGSTYNLMPEKYVQLYRRFRENDLRGAMQAQEEINRIIQVVLQYPLIPAIKCGLEMLGFEAGPAAYPGKRLSGEERNRLRAQLAEARLFSEAQ